MYAIPVVPHRLCKCAGSSGAHVLRANDVPNTNFATDEGATVFSGIHNMDVVDPEILVLAFKSFPLFKSAGPDGIFPYFRKCF